MIRWLLLLALALWITVLVLVLAGYAKAAEPVQVTPALVCAVHDAIKLVHSPRWNILTCEQVAEALSETRDPQQTLAIAVNESDLRPDAIHWRATGGADVGLMGVFCLIERGAKDDTCTNRPGGMTVRLRDLFNPVTNIRVATLVLVEKGGSLKRYSGSTREHGYEARVHAIEAAFGGVAVKTGTARMEKLVGQIAKAVRP